MEVQGVSLASIIVRAKIARREVMGMIKAPGEATPMALTTKRAARGDRVVASMVGVGGSRGLMIARTLREVEVMAVIRAQVGEIRIARGISRAVRRDRVVASMVGAEGGRQVGMGMIQAMGSRVVARARTQAMGDSSLVVGIAMILGIRGVVGSRIIRLKGESGWEEKHLGI
jgi:hypothetical protein